MRGGFYLPEEGEVRVRTNRASCNPSRLGLGWGLYLWRRVVPWPCGKTKKLTRAHARVDSQSPATGYWARCVLSARGRGCHEGATTFTHCRWAGEFRCWKIFSGRKLLFNVTEKQGVKSRLIKRRNELASQGFEEQKRVRIRVSLVVRAIDEGACASSKVRARVKG